MNKTPTSVVVLSIIGLILTAWGLLGFIGVLVIMFVGLLPATPGLEIYKDPIYREVVLGAMAVGMIGLAVLAASAIGSFQLKPWARKGMLVYAYYSIFQNILGMIFNFAYVLPKMAAMRGAAAGPAATGGMIGGVIGGFVGGCLGLAFPICVLIFYNRQNVKDAFNGIFPVPPTNFPVEFPAGGPSQFQ